MDSGRLGVVRRQENSRRKFVFMLNEVMRSQYEVVDDYLSREKFEIGVKYDKSFVPIRRSIVKQRVLQQCLKMKRHTKKMTNRNLGAYSGKPLYTFHRDIEKFIADMHPKLRRLKQAEKALKEGIEKGRILDPEKVPNKIDQYFEKNWKGEGEINNLQKPKLNFVDDSSKDILQRSRNKLPPIKGLVNPFSQRLYKDIKEDDLRDDSADISTLSKPHETDNSVGGSKENKHDSKDSLTRESTKGKLILPPIQQSKLMVKR